MEKVPQHRTYRDAEHTQSVLTITSNVVYRKATGTPLVPRWTDGAAHVSRLAAYVAGLGNVQRVDVLGYHRLGRDKYADLGMRDRLRGVPAASPAQVAQARGIFTDAGLQAF